MDVVVGPHAVRTLSRAAIDAVGMAAEVARRLVAADLSGHDSHGVLRQTRYVGELDLGLLKPVADTAMLRSTAAVAPFDGNRCFGQLIDDGRHSLGDGQCPRLQTWQAGRSGSPVLALPLAREPAIQLEIRYPWDLC